MDASLQLQTNVDCGQTTAAHMLFTSTDFPGNDTASLGAYISLKTNIHLCVYGTFTCMQVTHAVDTRATPYHHSYFKLRMCSCLHSEIQLSQSVENFTIFCTSVMNEIDTKIPDSVLFTF